MHVCGINLCLVKCLTMTLLGLYGAVNGQTTSSGVSGNSTGFVPSGVDGDSVMVSASVDGGVTGMGSAGQNTGVQTTAPPGGVWPTPCHVLPSDRYLVNKVRELVARKAKLIEYNIHFPDYDYNPLRDNSTWSYQADVWARVSRLQGQTLLSLAFNYGVLSLMTLTFGTEYLHINMTDTPKKCFDGLSETLKVATMTHIMIRDFQDVRNATFVEDERICHEVIDNDHGYGKFRDRCCYISRVTHTDECTTDITNIWLSFLFAMLVFVKFAILLFGPLWFVDLIDSSAMDNIPYIVKLKEKLKKKFYLLRPENPLPPLRYKHVLNLRRERNYPKLTKSVQDKPVGEIFDAEINQFDILVSYKRLLPETKVPVGLLHSLGRSLFLCKMKTLAPCQPCCDSNLLHPCSTRHLPWYALLKKVGLISLVFIVPLPMYVRVVVYYLYESEEVEHRADAMSKMGLHQAYEGSLIHFLRPHHPLFIMVYISYFLACIVLGLSFYIPQGNYLRQIIIKSFKDLRSMSFRKPLGMVVANILWPFRKCGCLGCILALVYWPVAVPISLAVAVMYAFPIFYVTFRMMYNARASVMITKKHSFKKYAVHNESDNTIKLFETERLLQGMGSGTDEEAGEEEEMVEMVDSRSRRSSVTEMVRGYVSSRHHIVGIVITVSLCIVAMLAVLLALSECIGFLVEMAVFTLMGIIVNAGSLLKFISLLLLVIIYSYDCYNNVYKRYMKLSKALFSEVKGRIKDLSEVTSLPSYLQENRGFKSVENSEQADYEMPDDLTDQKKLPKHWMLNDLILFIDNEDMPRIPVQLFEEVCGIRVAGAPGPVYKSLLEATQQFIKIVFFLFIVFLIILSFGNVYQVSETNKTMATLFGGLLPLILRNFMQPARPDPELGTVSFKSKLDEIIINFRQNWPIFDFPFQLETPDEEEDGDGKEGDKEQTPDATGGTEGAEGGAIEDVDGTAQEGKKPEEEKTEAEEKYDVDIIVWLPEVKDADWPEVWSDIEEEVLNSKPRDNNNLIHDV